MSSHSYDNFIGTKFLATIGEPWDFVSKSGAGRLAGVVKSVMTSIDGIPVIRCKVDGFEKDGILFYEVFAVNRYKKSQDLLLIFTERKRTGVNLCFFDGSLNLSDDMAMQRLFDAPRVDFLVGSIQI